MNTYSQSLPGTGLFNSGHPLLVVHSKSAPFLHEVQRYVLQNLAESISITSLAGAFFISRVELFRRIKRATGDSPSRYVSKLRIRVAAELLVISELPVRQIAYLTGFRDAKYFSRLFMRIQHKSPAAFRMDKLTTR